MVTRIKFAIFFIPLFVVINVEAYVRRDVQSETPSPNFLDAFHYNIDQFRECIDQSLARTAGAINEKQLQPLFIAISDHLGRVSKAFDDLTAPKSIQEPDAQAT